METKHTPGKWVACGSDTSLATWVSSHTGTRICTMRQCEDDWANAQLIAQAPDLLAERDRLAAVNAELVAALEGLLNIGAVQQWLDESQPACARRVVVKRTARTALAKAEEVAK